MKTSRKKRSRMVAAIPILMTILFAFAAGSILVEDAPQRSDVILVLAGEANLRPIRGLELLDTGYAPRMVIDVPAGARIYGISQLELAKKYVQSLPQAGSVDICPIFGLSTRDEVRDVQRCLASQLSSRVLIVTSDFHTRRALSIFRHELRGTSFSVAAAHDDAQFGTHWWTHRQWAKTFLDEWLRLIWWNVVERWRSEN